MKRLLLNLLCVLFAYPCFAAEPIQLARMNPWVAGSVASAPASCTTSNDSALKVPVTQPGTSQSAVRMKCWKFAIDATKTITAYKIRECYSGSGSGTASIYSHNSGDNKPNAKVSTNYDVTLSTASMSVCNTDVVDDYNLTTPQSLTAGTYWLCADYGSDIVVDNYYGTSTGDRVCYTSNGTDYTCIDDCMYDMEVWGCD